MTLNLKPPSPKQILIILFFLAVFLILVTLIGDKSPNFGTFNNELQRYADIQPAHQRNNKPNNANKNDFHVWLIFTKVTDKSPLRYKFHNLLANILNISSIPLKFHIIVDKLSQQLAVDEISDVVSSVNKGIHYTLYDVKKCAKAISDIVRVMTPHFSSKPGTYYSDALFYISLGLHRIAPLTQDRAVLLDCDLYFKQDIALLFKQFDSFKPTALFGLAPELTPVYRHILHSYKAKHNTTFGEYYHSINYDLTNSSMSTIARGSTANLKATQNPVHPRGFQGYNSGVVLIKLSSVRNSPDYAASIRNQTVEQMTSKYKFRGHLGDQDFYTLLGYERPHLIQTLNCGFNRQLCTWWRDHGYADLFDFYFKCEHPVVVLHGNCNTRIPKR